MNRDRKRILIDSSVGGPGHDQLGSEVLRCSYHHASTSQSAGRLGAGITGHDLGYTKITEVDVAMSIEKNVCGFHIAMNVFLAVNEIECRGDRFQPIRQLLRR